MSKVFFSFYRAWETRFSSTVKTNGIKIIIIIRTRRKLNGKRNGMKINGKRHLTWKEIKKEENENVRNWWPEKWKRKRGKFLPNFLFSFFPLFFISHIIFLRLSRALIVCHFDDIFTRAISFFLTRVSKKEANGNSNGKLRYQFYFYSVS